MTELYPSQADTQFQQRPLTLDYLKQDIDERIRRIRVLLGMLPSDGYHPQRLLQDKLENKSQYIQADFVQENALREITSVRNTLSPLASPDKLSSK